MPSRILYIEDNIDNLILVRRVLASVGYEVLEATSAQEGIRVAARCLPDLILVDINMPEIDGLTATVQLRQLPGLENVPIVALTANVMKGVLDKAEAVGCDGYIAKPIDVDRLPEQVSAYLSGNGRSTLET
jgi:two-component system cell cycle response regulator DivK